VEGGRVKTGAEGGGKWARVERIDRTAQRGRRTKGLRIKGGEGQMYAGAKSSKDKTFRSGGLEWRGGIEKGNQGGEGNGEGRRYGIAEGRSISPLRTSCNQDAMRKQRSAV